MNKSTRRIFIVKVFSVFYKDMGAIASALGEILKFVGKQVIDGTAGWVEYEHAAVSALRHAGHSGENLRAMTKSLVKDVAELSKTYGITFKDAVAYQQKFNDITKSSAVLSTKSLEDFASLSKILGDQAPFEWAKAMHNFGMSAENANAWLGKGAIQAKALGLNAQQFAEEMAKSAQLQNKLNFRSGIDGLQKMTGLAMRLGVSVETLTKHADITNGSFSDIEKSIDAAAQLQRLGGSFAANFGNPLEVMAEGMFDAESAAERVANTFKGKGIFDRASGEVKQSWVDKKQISVASQALGISYDEAMTMANRQAMGGEMDKDLRKNANFSNFKQQDLDAIKNLAQFNADKNRFEINYTDENGNKQAADIQTLTPEKLDKIIGLTKDEKDINANVASIAGKVGLIADTIHGTAKDVTTGDESRKGSKESAELTKTDWMTKLGVDKGIEWLKGTGQKLPSWAHWIADSGIGIVENFLGRANGGIVEATPTGIDGIQKFANGGIVNDGYKLGDIIAPQTKGYDSGGLVSGDSTSGDKVLTRVNSGEMVLNKAQQSRLYEIAASSGYGKTSVSNAGVNTVKANLVTNLLPSAITKVGEAIQGVGNHIDKSSQRTAKILSNPARAARKAKQLGRLAKSAYVAKIAPTRALSNTNFASRVARHKLNKVTPTVVKYWEKAATIADSGRGLVTKGRKAVGKGIKAGYTATKTAIANTKTVQGAKAIANKAVSKVRSRVIGRTMMHEMKVVPAMNKVADKFSKAAEVMHKAGGYMSKGASKIAGGVSKGAGKVAGWAGKWASKGVSGAGKLVSKAGPLAGKITKSANSAIVKGAGKLLGSKAASLVKGAGPLGTAISAGIGIFEASKAISNFSNIKEDINNRQDISEKEKKQLIRNAEDDRNESVGKATGSVAGAAIGATIGSAIPVVGTAIGGMIGGFIGDKVGGFIGKNANKAKDFLFGKKEELSEEDQAQLDYEQTKMGQTDISDPQLMEKAAVATCGMHDLLVSIWNHMNGKTAMGNEQSKGLFGKMGDMAKGAIGVVGKVATAPLRLAMAASPIGAVKSWFDKRKEKKEGEKKKKKEGESPESNINSILTHVESINANVEAIASHIGVKVQENTQVEKTEGNEIKPADEKKKKIKKAAKVAAAVALAPLSPISSALMFGSIFKGKVKAKKESKLQLVRTTTPTETVSNVAATKEGKSNVTPKPLGEEPIRVKSGEETASTASPMSTSNYSDTIKLEVSGTIKLDGGTATKDIDMRALLDNPAIKQKLIDLVYEGMESRGGFGRINRNAKRNVLNGSTANMGLR